MKEKIEYCTNEIWKNLTGTITDTDRSGFWSRNNLDGFPLELLPQIKGTHLQITSVLEKLQNAYMYNNNIEYDLMQYEYDNYKRLIETTKIGDTGNLYASKITYTPEGKIVHNNTITQGGKSFGYKRYHMYENTIEGNKETIIDISINDKCFINNDVPIQLILIDSVLRSSTIGNKIRTELNEFGHVVKENKLNLTICTENIYDSCNNRIKLIQRTINTINKDTNNVQSEEVRTFRYDEMNNCTYNSMIPYREYSYEYYTSMGIKRLHRVLLNSNVVLEIPKF